MSATTFARVDENDESPSEAFAAVADEFCAEAHNRASAEVVVAMVAAAFAQVAETMAVA